MKFQAGVLRVAWVLVFAGLAPAFASRETTVVGLDGQPVELDGLIQGAKATVFFFTRTDCPISNRYAPEIRRIYSRFQAQGVFFRLVYVDPDQSVEAIRDHIRDYEYPFEALLDPGHQLVARSQVKVTPEVAVFVPGGDLVYRGRIDDRFPGFGRSREPTERDLEDALGAVLAGRPVARPRTEAVGCFIQDLR